MIGIILKCIAIPVNIFMICIACKWLWLALKEYPNVKSSERK